MKQLPQGKIPNKLLMKIISNIKSDETVLVKPRPGFDSSIIAISTDKLVVSTDPAILIPRNIPYDMFAFGAVHFVASDISVFGAVPRYMLYDFLVPVGFKEKDLLDIATLVNKYAEELGVIIIGGHTGAYYGLEIPIISSTMIGFLIHNDPILPSNAKPGDKIILTKYLGQEFLVALYYYDRELLERIIGSKNARKYKYLYKSQSVVNEATLLTRLKLINAMHDVTEGGLLSALNEVADASGLGFKIHYNSLPLNDDIIKVFDHLNINPLKVSSTGCLLVATPSDLVEKVLKALRKENVPVSIIGEFIEDKSRRIIIRENETIKLNRDETDEFAKFFKI